VSIDTKRVNSEYPGHPIRKRGQEEAGPVAVKGNGEKEDGVLVGEKSGCRID
jgi:hypothetical protein